MDPMDTLLYIYTPGNLTWPMAKLCFFGDYIFSRENIVQTFISRSIGLSEYGSHLTIELMSLSRTTPGDVAWMMRQESFVANRWGGVPIP